MFFGPWRLFSILVKKPGNGPGWHAWGAQAVRFGFFWPFSARKPRNRLGWQTWAPQACYPGPFPGFLTKIEKSRQGPKNIPNGYFYKKDSTAELELQISVFFIQQTEKIRRHFALPRSTENCKKTTKKHNKKHHGTHKRSLGPARQLSAFPGQKTARKQPKNTTKKHHGTHKRLNCFVIPLSGRMAYLTQLACHPSFTVFPTFISKSAVWDGTPVRTGVPSNCKALYIYRSI